MALIHGSLLIRERPTVVFDFVTTPEHWPRWHPSSVAVRGATDHSLQIGEQVSEDFVVAGRRGTVTWTVIARDAPRHWAIEGIVAGGGRGTITYTLAPEARGTLFEREFQYSMPNPIYALLDLLVVRRRIRAESTRALHNLARVLEARPPATD